MKLTAKGTTIFAFILLVVSLAIPVAFGNTEDGFMAYWMIGIAFEGETGEFNFYIAGETMWAFWFPIFTVSLVIAGIHLAVSLLSKTAYKRLNRTVGGDIIIAIAIAYFVGVYTSTDMFINTVPIGLIAAFIAGLMGIWAGRLTRTEESPQTEGGP